ncbi:hypothetical protein PspS34_27780 [Pseudomonas sp. S34]|nr:hypothetical protein PspS34_27780 [Pseudomonas sp. S34]
MRTTFGFDGKLVRILIQSPAMAHPSKQTMAVQDESAMRMRRRQQQVAICEPDGEASVMPRLVAQCGET